MSTKPTKDVVHAIKWLAAEFKYLQELQQLLDMEQYFDERQTLACINYIGKAERRAEKDVTKILTELKAARKEEIPRKEIEETLKQIEIPAGMLIKYGSFYVGKLREELNGLRTAVQRKQKYAPVRWGNTFHDRTPQLTKVEQELTHLKTEIKQLVLWVSALDAALIKAKDIFEEIETEQNILHKVKSVDDVVAVLSQPEKKQKKTLAELFRRRQLRTLGLKGSKKIRRETADIYFFKNFHLVYNDLLLQLGWSAGVIKKHLLKYASPPDHLVLFPLLGSLFNYYVAKGIHQEMLRGGLGKGLKLLTIQPPPAAYDDEEKSSKEAIIYLNEQVKLILKKNKADTFTILDFSSRGGTIDRISRAFQREGIHYRGYDDPKEHQEINLTPAAERNNLKKRLEQLDDLRHEAFIAKDYKLEIEIQTEIDRCKKYRIRPTSLFVRTRRGKIIPLSHLQEMQEKPKLYSTVFPSGEAPEQTARISFIKELLIAFGRVYYYLGEATE
ncbi:MAG: hypothetical protein AABW48_03240 [Nanoarchaeota archaeon]